MWIISTDGFVSAVEDRNDPSRLLVRARARKDLDRLRDYVPELGETKRTLNADYRYRASCSKAAFADGLRLMALDIDYPNFKSAVADKGRKRFYERVWGVLAGIQPGGPWNMDRRKRGLLEFGSPATGPNGFPEHEPRCPECGRMGSESLELLWVCRTKGCRLEGTVYLDELIEEVGA